ncbi:MAG: sigma-54 dependent transcriptional regulator [Thermodesulfobacteriota bacterium]
MQRVLIVDDEELIRASLQKAATEEGYEVFLAENGKEALNIVEKLDFDLVLLDLRLPDINGVEVLKKIKEIDEDLLVIIITGYASVESAVEAIKIGAYDYIKKPFKADYIKLILKLALDKIKLNREVQRFIRTQRKEFGFENIIGQSSKMKEVFHLLKKVIQHDTPTVLIRGESGTGKELIARAIHGMSRRTLGAFIEIDCASMPAALLESELFGYEKGAFTDANRSKPGLLEEADKGTIFFDEIGDMDLILQKKILRVLEEKSFRRLGGLKKVYADFRIIASTNRNLETLVSEVKFREDLYYRLNVMPIFLPPLREREEDVLLLAKFFIAKFNKEYRKKVEGLSPEAESFLARHPWPGNVRELKNVIERIMIVNEVKEILPEHLPDEILSKCKEVDAKFPSITALDVRLPDNGIDFNKIIEKITFDLKKQIILQALERVNGNKSKAARLLGLSRSALG